MMRFTRWLMAMLLCATAVSAQEGKRVALIVGNDAYSIRPLQNAVNDARLMDKALRGAGFRTILRENATRLVLEQALSEFLASVAPGDTALFFYAGHAVQIENENVLIPVDFTSAKNLIEAKIHSFSLALVFDFLKRTRAGNAIVIVDACRSNPVAEGHALQAGLAQPMSAATNTYIAYSTSPNHVANDNPDGRNSWFTEALAAAIEKPGLTLDEAFTRVRREVETATRGAQTPWSTTSLTSTFYFHPPSNLAAMNDVNASARRLQMALKDESRGNWDDAISALNRVVKEAPGSTYERLARQELPYAMARKEAAARLDAADYALAAQRLEEAFKANPFAFDAGTAAANSYLVGDDISKAIPLLVAVRQRGNSAAVRKADAMLKELAAVQPEADQELKRGLPPPPPIAEIFPGAGFGVPDWEQGKRLARETSVDFGQWAAKMPLMNKPIPQVEAPAAAETVTTAEAAGPITLDSFHVEVQSVAGGRDLVREEFGELQISSTQANAAVMLDGKSVAKQLPYTLRVPAGKYEIRTVDHGRTMNSKQVEVAPGRVVDVVFK